MQILILGGTAMLGRAIAQAGLDRGHAITCLARGTSSTPPEGATFVQADRDDPRSFEKVAGLWDAVVDVGRDPGRVRAAVAALDARHWVYMSSASVYTRSDQPEQKEDAPIHEPLAADRLTRPEDYGSAKVACENEVQSADAPAAIIRAGLIGGAGDDTSRSGYYPWRFAHPSGPDVLVPDDLDFPCALIDVADLAAWVITLAEQRTEGVFNATGPTTTLGEVLATAHSVAGAPSSLAIRPVPLGVLESEGVAGWMGPKSLPLWVPDPDFRHIATLNTDKARANGLVTRPLAETLADALAFEDQRTTGMGGGLTDAEEQELRAAAMIG